MREEIKGSTISIIEVLDGNYRTSDAERTVSGWLRVVLSGKCKLDLIGCQNDPMAIGVMKALEQVADHFKKPEIRNIPVTGCDGLRAIGQKLVREGKLAATPDLPRSETCRKKEIKG